MTFIILIACKEEVECTDMYRDRNSPVGIADMFAANPMGLFPFSDIQFYPVDAVAEFSCENGLWDFAEPFFVSRNQELPNNHYKSPKTKKNGATHMGYTVSFTKLSFRV